MRIFSVRRGSDGAGFLVFVEACCIELRYYFCSGVSYYGEYTALFNACGTVTIW
jgi:hypothetical protein